MVSNLIFKVIPLLERTYIKNQWKLQKGDQDSLPLLTQLFNTACAADRALWGVFAGARMTSRTSLVSSQASPLYSNFWHKHKQNEGKRDNRLANAVKQEGKYGVIHKI